MSNAFSAIAQSIVNAVQPIFDDFVARAAAIVENDKAAEKVTVKAADLSEKINSSEDAAVLKIKAAIEKDQAALTEIQKRIRESRKAAQEILFPGTTGADVWDEDERKAKIAEAAAMRKTLVDTYKSALAVDPEFTLPELPPVVGQRGRQAGFVSNAQGKSKPRVSAISLDGKALEKATFGNLQKAIKGTTGVAVDNDVLIADFFSALGTEDWQSDSVKGKTVEWDKVVNTESGRSVKISVTV